MWTCSRTRSRPSRCSWGTWTTSTCAGRSSTRPACSTGRWRSATRSRCRRARRRGPRCAAGPRFSWSPAGLSAAGQGGRRESVGLYPHRACILGRVAWARRRAHGPARSRESGRGPTARGLRAQSITALAHLRAAVLYIVDISEQCGFTIAQQARPGRAPCPARARRCVAVVCNAPQQLSEELRCHAFAERNG
jgi:hypothetical protein